MKDFRFTIIVIILSIISNLLTPFIQILLYDKDSINLKNYWYIFVIIIVIIFMFDLIRLLLDKDKCDLWRSRIYKILFKLNSSKGNEKKYILNDLNSRINLARRQLDYTNTILPKLVDIEWIDTEFENTESYELKEGQFVIKVSNSNSQDKNIINIISAVTKRTSLVGLRYILDKNKELETSIDEVITENMIKKINNKRILDFYYRDYLQFCLENNEKIQKYFTDLKDIDNIGMFFRIFLVELEFFSNRIIGQGYKPFLLGEIEFFLNYLKNIRPERTPDKVELSYEKAFLKLGIILVRSEKILQIGTENYLQMVDHYLNHSFNSFYLIYFEKQNYSYWRRFNSLIESLIIEIKHRITVEEVFDEHYPVFINENEKRIGRCIRFINTEKL